MLSAIRPITLPSYATYLEQPITAEELYIALKSGVHNKAPGSDGISREFYIRLWDIIREDMLEIMNQMYIHKSMTRRQQHGIIVSLPKNNGDKTPAEYRPITLMNMDYKILYRIMARRLSPVPDEQLTSRQYCTVPGKSILEALSVLQNVIAHAELTHTPLCVLSLDFKNAFDRISHRYLFQKLAGYGVSAWFIDRIHSIYGHATASCRSMAPWPDLSPFKVPSDRDVRLVWPCTPSAYIPACAHWRTD